MLVGALGLIAASSVAVASAESKIEKQCVSGDCVNGQGVMEYWSKQGKSVYRGEFRQGLRHGYGKYESLYDRSNYAGHWARDKKLGFGTYWNGADKLYIGHWKGDKRHGQGSYFFGLKDWSDNKHTASWLVEHVENYTGAFQNDLYHGKGIYRWQNGTKYVGKFFANKKHGAGYFDYGTGNVRHQVWEYGKLVE